MTKEELEKEATEWVRQKFPMLDLKQSDMSKIHEYEAYIASAEPREKRIAELEEQIEKMKCCQNCKKLEKEKDGLLFCTVGSFYTNAFGKNCDKWEIKENDNIME